MTPTKTQMTQTSGSAPEVDTPEDEIVPLRLSFSQIEAYINCPQKWKYAKVDRLPTAPSPTLSYGTSLHAAIEHWYKTKIEQAPPVEVLLEGLKEHWESDGFAEVSRDEQIRWYRQAQQVLRRFHARYAPQFKLPVASEQWFELPFDDGLIILVGSIDHTEPTSPGRYRIIDWKSSRKAKTRKQVAESIQLGIYALAAKMLWGHLPDSVALDFVVPGVLVEVGIDEIDLDRVERTVLRVADAIRAEQFDPTPNRLCDWCDFRAVCSEYQGDGPDVRGLAVRELEDLRRRMAKDAARASELDALLADPRQLVS